MKNLADHVSRAWADLFSPPTSNESSPAVLDSQRCQFLSADGRPGACSTWSPREKRPGPLYLQPTTINVAVCNPRIMNTYTRHDANSFRMRTYRNGGCKSRVMNTYKKGGRGYRLIVTLASRRVRAAAGPEPGRGSSHKQFKHPTKKGRVTVVYPQRDIPKGTLRSIERQAQIDLG